MSHVEDVACCEESVHAHPEVPDEAELQVIDPCHDSANNHENNRQHGINANSLAEEVVVARDGEHIGEVLDDGDHGHVQVNKAQEARQQHANEKQVDGKPVLYSGPVKNGQFD